MRIINKLTLLIIVLLLISCKTNHNKNTFWKKVNLIENSWSKDEKIAFKNKAPDKFLYYAVTKEHSDFEDWWFKHRKNVELINFFKERGIYRGGDMTKLIYLAVYEKLNNRNFDIDRHIKNIKDSYFNCHICIYNDSLKSIKSLVYYNKYSLKDTILIKMPMDSLLFGKNNVAEYSSDFDIWEYNVKRDLLLKGFVLNKSNKNDTINRFFKIKILKLNKKNIKIFSEKVNIGDTINIDLENVYIETTTSVLAQSQLPQE